MICPLLFYRIIDNVFPYISVIIFISDNVVVKRFLPYRKSDLFCNSAFGLLYYTFNRRGDQWSPAYLGMYL